MIAAGISFHRHRGQRAARCEASGWRIHHACCHGGMTTCPGCGREVRVSDDITVAGRVLVVIVAGHPGREGDRG